MCWKGPEPGVQNVCVSEFLYSLIDIIEIHRSSGFYPVWGNVSPQIREVQGIEEREAVISVYLFLKGVYIRLIMSIGDPALIISILPRRHGKA